MGPEIAIDTGDTAWVLGAAALVLFMTPGLALFYGGLVRSKNVLGTMMQSVAAIAIVSVVWLLAGYTLRVRPRRGRCDRRPRAPRVPRGRGGAARARAHRAAHGVRLVPADVRRDHAGADRGRVRRAGPVRRLRGVRGALVAPRVLAAGALGLGRRVPRGRRDRRAGLRRRHRGAHQRRRGRPRGGSRSSGSAAATRGGTSRRTTSRWWSSARASSGSDGSDSTPGARSGRTGSRPRPSSPRISAPPAR